MIIMGLAVQLRGFSNLARYLFNQLHCDVNKPPTDPANDYFLAKLIQDAEHLKVGIYWKPPHIWMAYNSQGRRGGPDLYNYDWLYWNMGMAVMIGAKMRLDLETIRSYASPYGWEIPKGINAYLILKKIVSPPDDNWEVIRYIH